jgi:3-deoxy-7-phosphoheptulonate synthase/chorismate mutase
MSNSPEDNKLVQFREEIDSIDLQILELLKKRFDLAINIAETKKTMSKQIVDINREYELIKRLEDTKLVDPFIIKHLWTEIIYVSRCLQKDYINGFKKKF